MHIANRPGGATVAEVRPLYDTLAGRFGGSIRPIEECLEGAITGYSGWAVYYHHGIGIVSPGIFSRGTSDMTAWGNEMRDKIKDLGLRVVAEPDDTLLLADDNGGGTHSGCDAMLWKTLLVDRGVALFRDHFRGILEPILSNVRGAKTIYFESYSPLRHDYGDKEGDIIPGRRKVVKLKHDLFLYDNLAQIAAELSPNEALGMRSLIGTYGAKKHMRMMDFTIPSRSYQGLNTNELFFRWSAVRQCTENNLRTDNIVASGNSFHLYDPSTLIGEGELAAELQRMLQEATADGFERFGSFDGKWLEHSLRRGHEFLRLSPSTAKPFFPTYIGQVRPLTNGERHVLWLRDRAREDKRQARIRELQMKDALQDNQFSLF